MIHLVFDRPNATLKAYDSIGSLYAAYPASGDSSPAGHYTLGSTKLFDPPGNGDGYGKLVVKDIDVDTLASLVKSGRATANGLSADIGGVTLHLGQGSPSVMARMLSKDWHSLDSWLTPQYDKNTVVLSLVGD